MSLNWTSSLNVVLLLNVTAQPNVQSHVITNVGVFSIQSISAACVAGLVRIHVATSSQSNELPQPVTVSIISLSASL